MESTGDEAAAAEIFDVGDFIEDEEEEGVGEEVEVVDVVYGLRLRVDPGDGIGAEKVRHMALFRRDLRRREEETTWKGLDFEGKERGVLVIVLSFSESKDREIRDRSHFGP